MWFRILPEPHTSEQWAAKWINGEDVLSVTTTKYGPDTFRFKNGGRLEATKWTAWTEEQAVTLMYGGVE